MREFLVAVLALFVGASLPGAEAEYRTVCYYASWAVTRDPRGTYPVEQIDPNLCTHLVYAFAGIDGNSVFAPNLDSLQKFNQLKQRNPKVKTMIAVGGWEEGCTRFSTLASTDSNRKAFAQNAAGFVRNYGFDGLDVDWEYPSQREGSRPDDVQNFVSLLRELRTEFDKYGLILSVAVGATEYSITTSYNVPMISQYVNFINLMTYDMHGSWEQVTGYNAGLLDVKTCVDIWLKKGADPKKINLGMPFYGRSYTLKDSRNTGVNSAASGPGNAGPYTKDAGVLAYNEIVELQKKGGWTRVWDNNQKVPYMYNGNQWVSYDDTESITQKVNLAKNMGLGGGMIWTIDMDDFVGDSGTINPLLKAINNGFGMGIPAPAPTPTSTTTTTRTTTTTTTTRPPAPASTSDPASLCKENYSYVRDPSVCSKFYFCMIVYGQFKAYEFNCGPGTVFDPKITACNWPSQVNCSN